ncbi:MAG TPA: transglutaminase domain-containing protein [Phycisphaeraceae bacterium]|nr:transglutaminase domain-containing protein [Phycisphaeraceae bacterium]
MPVVTTALLCCVLSAPPIVEKKSSKDWTVDLEVHVRAARREVLPGDREVCTEVLNLENTPVVFPVIPEGPSHETDPEKITSEIRLSDKLVNVKTNVVGGYPLHTSLFTWNIKKFNGYEFSFSIKQNITCYDINIRRDIAAELPWPDKWPTSVADALKPQLFIESDDKGIHKLVDRWTNKNVRSVPPYIAAKAITGQVIQYVQKSGKNWKNDERGRFAGFDVQGAKYMLHNHKGTENDIVCFHVACLRAAGIPARPVIAMDARKKEFTVWSEFYLYDKERDEGVWIPIDIIGLRRRSSRAGDIDRPWKGFAQMDDLDFYIPLAYHFHPPTAVINAGPPALWGWDPRPEARPAEQYLTWQVYRTAKRGR